MGRIGLLTPCPWYGHLAHWKGDIHLQVIWVDPPHVVHVIVQAAWLDSRPVKCVRPPIVVVLFKVHILAWGCGFGCWWSGSSWNTSDSICVTGVLCSTSMFVSPPPWGIFPQVDSITWGHAKVAKVANTDEVHDIWPISLLWEHGVEWEHTWDTILLCSLEKAFQFQWGVEYGWQVIDRGAGQLAVEIWTRGGRQWQDTIQAHEWCNEWE